MSLLSKSNEEKDHLLFISSQNEISSRFSVEFIFKIIALNYNERSFRNYDIINRQFQNKASTFPSKLLIKLNFPSLAFSQKMLNLAHSKIIKEKFAIDFIIKLTKIILPLINIELIGKSYFCFICATKRPWKNLFLTV